MSVLRRIANAGLLSVQRGMRRVLDAALPDRVQRMIHGPHAMRLPLDIYETEEEIVIVASVLGLKPEDVEITMEGSLLTIRGQMPPAVIHVAYLLQERPTGAFSRSLTVHTSVDAEHAEAKFHSGVLTVILPKQQAATVRSQRIATRTRIA